MSVCMELNMKQWREEQMLESDRHQKHSAKIPKLNFHNQPQQQQQQQTPLPFFLSSESQPNKINFSTLPRLGGGGYWFSIRQWEELEIQALIYKHIMAGAQVPQQLLQLLTSSYYNLNLHQLPSHFQPLVEAGYWGKGAMDPEPGRCRRTDGKKWRCSRDVVVAHKYCDRHVHRGKNRSRKPVEFPPPSSATVSGDGVTVAKSSATAAFSGGQFSLSGSGASFDAFQLNQGSSELISDKKVPLAPQHGSSSSNNKVLMHFIDDWSRSLQETDDNGETNGNPSSSSTSLSIASTSNPTSGFLRLSTVNPVASMGMGGPLAEALRSSTHLSPTSVIH